METNNMNRVFSIQNDSTKFLKMLTKFTPSGLSCIDYRRNDQIENFYFDCQMHRAHFKDTTGRIRGIEYFKIPSKEYDTRQDPTMVYLRQSQEYFKLPQPVTYSLPIKRRVTP